MEVVYRLKVSQIEQTCLFELSWDKGRQLTAQLPFPSQLETSYQTWQRLYIRYYQSALRGRVVKSGQLTPQQDWQGQLVQAEAVLLREFQTWLRQEPLFEIRSELSTPSTPQSQTELLISCTPMALGRLPWEAWDINTEFGAKFDTVSPLRISRLPVNVREGAEQPKQQQRKARVLVILGDETNLDFEADLEAISTLDRLADIRILGWEPTCDIPQLKQTICDEIQAAPGWDMLLFFGHSNEENAVGGKVAIAPHTTLSMKELTPYLQRAKSQGLQFALFNSCQGLDIAQTLIGLGLSQVAVMREPIHNQVAQVFLIQFLKSLAQFNDVHTALKTASQSLRIQHTLDFPSAHLVPSLFRHGDARLFRLQPVGWQARVKSHLRNYLPKTRWQAAALCLATGLSVVAPVGNYLLAQRLWSQGVYRHLTQQIPSTPPPTILVQIDQDSIRSGIPSGRPNPMDRAYLAKIVDRLSALESQIIAIDYLLDRPQVDNDTRFAQSLSQAADQGTWLIFGAVLEADKEVGVREDLAHLNWAMQGYTNTPKWYLRALVASRSCTEHCPFSYLISLTQSATQMPITQQIKPSLDSSEDLRARLLVSIQAENARSQNQPDSPSLNTIQKLYTRRLSPLASLSRHWQQRWFHPVLDFSLPPTQVYDRLSADTLINVPLSQLKEQFDWHNQVIMVVAGDYGEAGTDFHKDYSPLPPAMAYWHQRQANPTKVFTGGEANAYAVHHFIQDHWVVPIPDLLLVGIGAIAGSALNHSFCRRKLSPRKQYLRLSGLSTAYGLLSLQLYISLSILLPWLLPTTVVWLYCLPNLYDLSNKAPSSERSR